MRVQATICPAGIEPFFQHSAHVSRNLYHFTHSSVFLQVVALCNELVGKVPCGTRQPVRANLRPVSLTTPAGRLDWDPAGEVGAEACACRFMTASRLAVLLMDVIAAWQCADIPSRLALTSGCSCVLDGTLKAMLLLEGDVRLQAAPAGADRSPAGILLSSAAGEPCADMASSSGRC